MDGGFTTAKACQRSPDGAVVAVMRTRSRQARQALGNERRQEKTMGGFGWIFVGVALPAAFLVVLAYALLRNRQTRAQRRVSEEGARRLQEEEERIRVSRDGH